MLAPQSKRLLTGTFVALGAAGVFLLVMLWIHPLRENGLDFAAFYCGAKTLAQHASPYLNQPLHDCEAATTPSFFALYPNVTVPAPLPPYALAAFIPLALLPYAVAKTLWFICLLSCTALVVGLTSKLAHIPASLALAASGVALLGPTAMQLALAPLPIALLMATAFFASKERWNAAAACMIASMIEPHVALPVALALFVCIPAMRLRLLGGALALSALSLILVGPKTLLWYFTVLLPGHAGSELNNLSQFSLTTVLYHAGIAGPLALHIGTAQYAFMLAFGVFIGRLMYRRFADPAFLIVGPAACSVIGGPFIHLTEIAVAIPLICMLTQRLKTDAIWWALALLSVPWEAVFNSTAFAPFAVMSLAWIVWYRWKPMPLTLMLGSIAMLILELRLHMTSIEEFLRAHARPIPAVAPTASSDITWAAFNAISPAGSFWWLGKGLTMAALVLLVAILMRMAQTRQPQAEWNTI